MDEALGTLTRYDYSRSLLQHNQTFYAFLRDGVPVIYRDAHGQLRHAPARMDYYKRYVGIVADYNREKDRVTLVEVFILDYLLRQLPTPPFTEVEKQTSARRVYQFVWQQSAAGYFVPRTTAA